jgi:hypothetical protein
MCREALDDPNESDEEKKKIARALAALEQTDEQAKALARMTSRYVDTNAAAHDRQRRILRGGR